MTGMHNTHGRYTIQPYSQVGMIFCSPFLELRYLHVHISDGALYAWEMAFLSWAAERSHIYISGISLSLAFLP